MGLSLYRQMRVASALAFLICACSHGVRAEEEGRRITISEGISMVLKDSRLLKISLAEKDMAVEDSLMARSALLPHLGASVTENLLSHQPAAKAGAQRMNTAERSSLSFGFDVYQTLFDFGKSLSNYRASLELVRARRETIEAVKKLAVLEFVTAYFSLLESYKMIEVAQKEVETLESYCKDVTHLYEQGAAIRNDLLPAKVRLADARRKLIVARNARDIAAMEVNNMLVLPLRERIRPQDIDMEFPQVPEREGAWKTAQEQRPEIKVIGDQIQASLFTEKAAAAAHLPALFADGGYGYTQNAYVTHEDNLFLTLGAKADVFDAGATEAAVSKEHDRQRQLFAQRDKLADDITMEIEDSYLGLSDAREKAKVAKEAVAEAEENVRVTRVQYAQGLATSTDVLEAIALQTSASTNYYNAEYEVKRNYAKLMYSMGIDLALFYGTMNTNSARREAGIQ